MATRDKVELRSRVKQLARERNIKNPRVLGEMAGISQGTAANLYKSMVSPSPTIDTLIKVAAALGVSVTDLYEVVTN